MIKKVEQKEKRPRRPNSSFKPVQNELPMPLRMFKHRFE